MNKRSRMPKTSVIIPVYNVKDYLYQCVDSVLSQDFRDFEIILVDDGSTDGSSDICDRYAKNQAQSSIISHNNKKVKDNLAEAVEIRVIHQKNQGLSSARNAGVREAKSEYLVFLDGDDYFEETALSAISRGLEPELDVLRYQAQEVFDDGREMRYEETGFVTTTGLEAFPKLAKYHYTENAWLYAYRREFWQRNHFHYAEGCIAEDLGLTPLIIAKAKSVKAISDICYNYRQRTGSIMHGAGKNEQRTRDILKQLQKTLPEVAKISGGKEISHYLVVSYLTEATNLGKERFLETYHKAKAEGFLKYIYPSSLRAFPRSILLKLSPKLFYRIYKV